MTKKTKKAAKTQKPLTISIHGNGIDIDAKFADSELGDVIAKVIKQTTTPPVVMPPTEAPHPQHDFDVVQRVIKHADTPVLQSILTLVNSALEQRAGAS